MNTISDALTHQYYQWCIVHINAISDALTHHYYQWCIVHKNAIWDALYTKMLSVMHCTQKCYQWCNPIHVMADRHISCSHKRRCTPASLTLLTRPPVGAVSISPPTWCCWHPFLIVWLQQYWLPRSIKLKSCSTKNKWILLLFDLSEIRWVFYYQFFMNWLIFILTL